MFDWRYALERLDYGTMVVGERDARTPFESYLVARALIILGRYNEAEHRVGNSLALNGTPLGDFLRLQLDVYRRADLPRSRRELLAFEPLLPKEPFFQGEWQFVLGYLHLLIDRYQQALRHHRAAAECYEAERLPAHVASCWFNLCVSYQNLNRRSLLQLYSGRLRELAQREPSPPILHLSSRNQAYWHIDAEEFESAVRDLDVALEICREQGRWCDVGGLACAKAYALLSLQDDEAFDRMLESLNDHRSQLTVLHQRALTEFCRFRDRGLVSDGEARACITRWGKLGLDSSYHLYLLHCLARALGRGQSYEAMLKVTLVGMRLSLQREQALSLVDFRYYQALGLFKTGQRDKALRVLAAYRADAAEVGAGEKVKRAEMLWKRMEGSSSAGRLVLNISESRLGFGGRDIDLSRYPAVSRFLVALCASAAARPIPEIFEAVYGTPYHPVRHLPRMNALIERTRALLARNGAVVRREGAVGLAPWIEVVTERNGGSADAADWRRSTLLRLIRKSQRGLAISEMESLFEESRRTLQLDLKHLIGSGLIDHSGSTRNRRYFAGRQA